MSLILHTRSSSAEVQRDGAQLINTFSELEASRSETEKTYYIV